MRLIDLTGLRFGRLTVIDRAENRRGLPAWNCHCDCGATVTVLGCNLRTMHTQSCGCRQKELTSTRSTKHKMTGSPIFGVWNMMLQRCTNPNNHKYNNYGGRGIRVCDEWKSFAGFYDCVSKLPHFGEAGYTLDRIDNNGNYEPSNVRWATYKEQNNNRRPRRRIRIQEI